MDLLYFYQVGPSQLVPNAWGFVRAVFGISSSKGALGSRPDAKWLYFSARVGSKIFIRSEFFRVSSTEGLEKETMSWECGGASKFPLYWRCKAQAMRPTKPKELTPLEK
jgi:hypothetical protein